MCPLANACAFWLQSEVGTSLQKGKGASKMAMQQILSGIEVVSKRKWTMTAWKPLQWSSESMEYLLGMYDCKGCMELLLNPSCFYRKLHELKQQLTGQVF